MNRLTLLAISVFSCFMFILGCESPEQDNSPMESASLNDNAAPEGENDPGTLASSFSNTTAAPASDECCENAGHASECWEADAERDGVTCTQDADCASGSCDLVLGLCTCSTDSQCGVYVENDKNNGETEPGGDPVGGYTGYTGVCSSGVCGPSWCNGYSICNCWGGCSWWNDNSELSPAHEAYTLGMYCCEGDYPSGGSATYFSATADCGLPCDDNADCDDGNECTSDICDLGTGNCSNPNLAAGAACGNDHSGDECWNGDSCDGAGNCDTDNYLSDTDTCGSDHSADECLEHDLCDGAGSCVADQNFSPSSTLCGVDNAGLDCENHQHCHGSANACVDDHVAVGSACDEIDTDLYPENCFDGLCGDIIQDTDTFSFGSNSGICENAILADATNDTCADAISLGSFTNSASDLNHLAIVGSTQCAANDYQAGGDNCRDSSNDKLGKDAPDVVYSFTYETNGDEQHQLYGFLVQLEADFDGVVYVYENDSCPSSLNVESNRCLNTYSGGDVWESTVNKLGNSLASQQCSTTAGSGYYWCERDYTEGSGGTWEYPDDPVPCEDDLSGTTSCDTHATQATRTYMSSAVVYTAGDEPTDSSSSGTTKTVYIFVDGNGSASGTFNLTVERLQWSAGPCERLNDDPRVFDITEINSTDTFVYQGNLSDAVNSWHDGAGTSCGGFDCGNAWKGTTSEHSSSNANQFWPNTQWFKIHPPAGSTATDYCIKTDNSVTDAADVVLEARVANTTNPDTICDLANTTQTDVAAGSSGVEVTASENQLWLIGVSEKTERNSPCGAVAGDDCNFRLEVTEGSCLDQADCEDETLDISGYGCSGGQQQPAGLINTGGASDGYAVAYGEMSVDCGDHYSAGENAEVKGEDAGWLIVDESSGVAKTLTILVVARPGGSGGVAWNPLIGLHDCDSNTNMGYASDHTVYPIPTNPSTGYQAWLGPIADPYGNTPVSWAAKQYTMHDAGNPWWYPGPYFVTIESTEAPGSTNVLEYDLYVHWSLP